MRLLEKLAKARKTKTDSADTAVQSAALLGTGAGVGVGLSNLRRPPSRQTVKTFADLAPDIANLARANPLEEIALRRSLRKLDSQPGTAMSVLRRMRRFA